jgi:hypothetical protein
MRKITFGPVVVFAVCLALAIILGVMTTAALLDRIAAGDFRGVTGVAVGLVSIYVYAVVIYRLFLLVAPLREGVIVEGSRDEFNYHVYLLFYLLLFQPLTRSLFLPVPLMRLIYRALGAQLGDNTYSAGTILDPPLTRVGHNTIIGHDAVLFSHFVKGRELSLAAIRIGDNVTIGAKAVIMPGVVIGDGAIVAVGAVVAKDSRIGSGELWGGIPARPIKSREPVDVETPTTPLPFE